MKTTVINLFGGPGCGKSTVATGLFSKMKQERHSCEYVSEYAKEITWEGTHALLENQIHVFAEQFRRQYRLLGKVSYIVTDSPLLLSAVYFDRLAKQLLEETRCPFSPDFIAQTRAYFISAFNQFENRNYILDRTKPYDTAGRNQSLDEARLLDKEITAMLIEATGSASSLIGGVEASAINSIMFFEGLEKCAS
jgi:hypothetical protein